MTLFAILSTSLSAQAQSDRDTLNASEYLVENESLVSANGLFELAYQDDGNLVLYRISDWAPLWASNTAGQPTDTAVMQDDGNFVVYRPGRRPIFHTGTFNNPGSLLRLQNDGNLVVYASDGRALWATGTNVPSGPVGSGGGLQPGEILGPGNALRSPDGYYTLVYQGDANLVLYRADGVATWASNTWGLPAGLAIMQGDGNLVVYGPDGRPYWSTETWNNPGSVLRLQSDGNLVIYRPDGVAIWASNTWLPTGTTGQGDRLSANQSLRPGDSLVSANGAYRLVLQGDGNLVIYRPGGVALWASNTWGSKVGIATLQGDGNFVLYEPGGTPRWSTDTYRDPNSTLVMQDDGNLVVYTADGRPIWASNTGT